MTKPQNVVGLDKEGKVVRRKMCGYVTGDGTRFSFVMDLQPAMSEEDCDKLVEQALEKIKEMNGLTRWADRKSIK